MTRAANSESNSAENPFPVRAVAIRVAGWIDRLGTVWVEGQLAQINMRPDTKTVFMVLRDPAADMSLTVTCSRDLVLNAPVKLAEGTQVVVCGKPSFYTVRGTFSLRLSEIRAVGIGELLARIDRLRRLLEAEGLFDPRLKRPIPFLPNMIGLITGRASAAERDVTTVAATRWPAVRFAVRNTAVQGPNAVAQIVAALGELDRDPDVDVIVLARGGGSVEDLLAVFRRDAVPRDRGLPHAGDQRGRSRTRQSAVRPGRRSARRDSHRRGQEGGPGYRRRTAVGRRPAPAQRAGTAQLGFPRTARAGPVAQPPGVGRAAGGARRRAPRRSTAPVRRFAATSPGWSPPRPSASVIWPRGWPRLGPAATLARGYAVVQTSMREPAAVLRSVDDAPAGTRLRVRVADGAVDGGE